jgi:hypothetical protein
MDTSKNYQNGLLKVLIRYAEYLGQQVIFYQIKEKQQILKFLVLKRKTEQEYPRQEMDHDMERLSVENKVFFQMALQ